MFYRAQSAAPPPRPPRVFPPSGGRSSQPLPAVNDEYDMPPVPERPLSQTQTASESLPPRRDVPPVPTESTPARAVPQIMEEEEEGIYVALPRLKKKAIKIKEGWLYKKGCLFDMEFQTPVMFFCDSKYFFRGMISMFSGGVNGNKGWDRRYFCYKDEKLVYYSKKPEKDLKPQVIFTPQSICFQKILPIISLSGFESSFF
jgi:hypothetical protein